MTDVELDRLYDDAMTATEVKSGPRTYFGQVMVDLWPCALIKGQGKVPFDAGVHSPDQRRTAVDMNLAAWSGRGGVYQVERSLIAESKDWTRIVRPSLQALNRDLRGVRGAWVQMQEVPTGEKYTTKTGEERERTALKFVAIYRDETECRGAMAAWYARRESGDTEPTANGAPAQTTQSPTNGGTTQPSNGDRATALKFLPALWKSSGGDVQKFERLLSSTPMVAKHFQINSPEVLTIIAS